MKNHAAVLSGENTRQQPAFLGKIDQQRAQVHFGANWHIGQDNVGSPENIPDCQAGTDHLASMPAGFIAQFPPNDFALMAKLLFLLTDGNYHCGIIAQSR